MFVQVIEGRVVDPDGLARQWRAWVEDLAPDAIGWVGSTGGITPDGRFIAAVRFESAEAAGENSRRPEQDRWWSETSKALEEVAFYESDDVDMMGEGSDEAGFVQVMHGRAVDRARLEALGEQMDARVEEQRPDLIGGYQIWLGDDAYVAVNYFTSEAEARAGESQEPPEDLAEVMREWQALLGEVRWFDLPDPWLDSPR